MSSIKCIAIGDETVGKTSIFKRCISNEFVGLQTCKTVYDNYSAVVEANGKAFRFEVLDVACHEEYDHWRLKHYENVNVCILCFSLVDPISFRRIRSRWYRETQKFASNAAILLIGTKLDLRNDRDYVKQMKEKKVVPISYSEGLKLSKQIGALSYLEVSAKTCENINRVFIELARVALTPARTKTCVIS